MSANVTAQVLYDKSTGEIVTLTPDEMTERYVKPMMDAMVKPSITLKRKLDIGGGTNPRDPSEYTSVDIAGKPDITAEMWDLPFPDATFAEIWSSHTLEHAPMGKIAETLREWFRVLKPGGKAIVQVPNFDYVAKYWLTGGDRNWAEAMVFGHQGSVGEFHKCAFTPAILKGDLEAAGFVVKQVDFRWCYNQETLQAVAKKPQSS